MVTLFVVEKARAPPNEHHPYGHGRYEAVGSLTVAAVLVATAGGVGWSALVACNDWWIGAAVPCIADSNWGTAALAACGVSLVVKEALFRITEKVGREVGSQTLLANAWHHRSDAFSSVAALVGVCGGMAGMPLVDPAAGLLVSGMVAKAGAEIGWEALQEVMERAAPDSEMKKMVKAAAADTPGIARIARLRTRKMGPYAIVDLRIEVDPLLTMSAAHNIARHLQSNIHSAAPAVSEVLVHIVPSLPLVPVRPFSEDGSQKLMRPHGEVEREVRDTLASIPEICGVEHVITYYIPDQGIHLKVDIVCSEDFTIKQAVEVARQAKVLLVELTDVLSVDVDLELKT